MSWSHQKKKCKNVIHWQMLSMASKLLQANKQDILVHTMCLTIWMHPHAMRTRSAMCEPPKEQTVIWKPLNMRIFSWKGKKRYFHFTDYEFAFENKKNSMIYMWHMYWIASQALLPGREHQLSYLCEATSLSDVPSCRSKPLARVT